MSFAALEAKANTSVLKHLANVRVRIGGGDPVGGIFKRPAHDVTLGLGAADSRPTLTLATTDVTDAPVDALIEVDGIPYMVVTNDPDGTGLSVLLLELTQ